MLCESLLLAALATVGDQAGPNVVINELMADNGTAIADEVGEFDPWFELYNPTGTTAIVSGMIVSNTTARWRIPPGHALLPGEHLLIWADMQPTQGPLHANVSLMPGGGVLELIDPAGAQVVDRVVYGPQARDVSTGRLGDGANLWVTFLDHSAGQTNELPCCGTRRYTPLDPTLSAANLALSGAPRLGTTPQLNAGNLPGSAPSSVLLGFAPGHLPLLFDPGVLLLSPPMFALASGQSDPAGGLNVPLQLLPDPAFVYADLYAQAFAIDSSSLPPGLTESNGLLMTLCPPDAISFSQAMIDDAMGIPPATSSSDFVGGGGPYYGRQAACMLYLSLVAHVSPAATSSSGALVLDRAIEHIKATATSSGTPPFPGGIAWFDQLVPLAWAVARRNPLMWRRLTPSEQDHLDLAMEHVLYAGAIFCQPNSTRNWMISSVRVDMNGNNAGSVPNQSAGAHAYMIGAYIYWGGVAAMDAILSAYDVNSFRARLQAAGLTTIKGYYDDPRIANLMEGIDQTQTLNPSWSVDPLGVRKTIAEFNTSSLLNSIPGEEHPYHRYDPIATTPRNLIYRWGLEFYSGAQPRSNVGPGRGDPCGGTQFGLVDHIGNLRATIPYEGQGIGMPYELNARGSIGGRHNRSSWHYATWGFKFFSYMYSTVALLGYFDVCNDPQDRELFEHAQKVTEIYRFIGANKWRSSSGPPAEVCTWNHGNGYSAFAGMHWSQDMLDALLFSGVAFPTQPIVP